MLITLNSHTTKHQYRLVMQIRPFSHRLRACATLARHDRLPVSLPARARLPHKSPDRWCAEPIKHSPENLIGAHDHRLLAGILAVTHLQHHVHPHKVTVPALHLHQQYARPVLLGLGDCGRRRRRRQQENGQRAKAAGKMWTHKQQVAVNLLM